MRGDVSEARGGGRPFDLPRIGALTERSQQLLDLVLSHRHQRHIGGRQRGVGVGPRGRTRDTGPIDAARLGSDLVHLPGGKWAIWTLVCVRGAGFPAAEVLRLSSPECARLAVDFLRVRTNRRRRVASARDGEPVSIAFEALKVAFTAETRRIRAVLRAVAADPAFREAVVWQNRRAFQHSVQPLVAASLDDSGSETRKRELLVASYLQRYSVKNDTIGFFGPVGWARFGDTRPAMAATYGPTLVAERQVYFESWCIDAVARVFDQQPELRPWRVPRMSAFARLDGRQLVVGSRAALTLTTDARLFAACDGTDHAQAIARRLCVTSPTGFPNDAAVYDRLEQWRQAGYLTWTFAGPLEPHPERTLRERLACIDDLEIS